jgi:hypothetical protein
LKGNPWINDTVVLPGELYPGQNFLKTFAPNEDFSTTGSWDIVLLASIQGDINIPNDTLNDTLSFWGSPFVNLGPNSTYKELSHTLDAGAGAHLRYLWSTGEKTQTINAVSTGSYNVTITDTIHGCYDQDTVIITLLIDDMGVQARDPDTLFCRNDFRGINLTLKNYGNLNYSTNKKIPLLYRLNGGSPVADTAVVSGLLGGGSTMAFTLDNFPVKPPPGTSIIKVYTKLTGDLKASNDTLTFQFIVFANTLVNLGGVRDSIRSSTLPYSLDAGSGFTSYAWNTGSTGQNISISSDGWYWVTATDANGCADIDSVFMFLHTDVENLFSGQGLVRIFPNPVNTFLYVQVESNTRDGIIVELINARSQVIYIKTLQGTQRFEDKIDLQTMPRGIYFLRIHNKDLMHIEKVIVN